MPHSSCCQKQGSGFVSGVPSFFLKACSSAPDHSSLRFRMWCRWSKGAFEEGAEGSATHQPTLPALQPQCNALAANLARHCEGQPAHHALLVGPTGGGKSWLLWEATMLAGQCGAVKLDSQATTFAWLKSDSQGPYDHAPPQQRCQQLGSRQLCM